MVATRDDGAAVEFQAIARVDSLIDVEYLNHGGILPMVLRQLIATPPAGAAQ